MEMSEEPCHLLAREYDGQSRRTLGSDQLGHPGQALTDDDVIEKQDRAQRLVLRRCAHTLVRQARKERRHLRLAQLTGMPLPVKDDEPPDPVDIRVLCAPAVVPRANPVPNPIEQLGLS
jgi:hypothetical protein